MRMSEFLLQNVEAILTEWEDFARTIQPGRAGMTKELLRDHAREMLAVIAHDMETAQSALEQQRKSRGDRVRAHLDEDSAAQAHGGDRLEQGFTLIEIVSEYRAMRASVIKLWTQEMVGADRSTLDELIRFGEAIDEAMTDSVTRYMARIGQERNLLLGALAHDLRNPLGAIMQSAQILSGNNASDSTKHRAVARISHTSKRMGAIISDVLDFACTQLGEHLPVSCAPMSMREACQLAIDEISALHPNHIFDLDAEEAWTGNWDRVRIGQMLSNLVGNAAEHGFLRTPIRVSCYGSDSQVCVEVHNEGPPIPASERRRIFEPLARGPSEIRGMPHRGRNLGLGLYIASMIAKAHGGAIDLLSSEKTGTTFIVRVSRQIASKDLDDPSV